MNTGLLFIPLALFASATLWMRQALTKPDQNLQYLEIDEGLGLPGTLILIVMVVAATLLALNQFV